MKPAPPVLDRLDWRSRELVQANARLSNTEVGKRIGLSQPAVTARIRRLEDVGVIEGYAAKVNPALVGLHTSALIRIRTTHAQIPQCLAAFAAMSEVAHMAQLEQAIDALARFGAVTTSVVLARCPAKGLKAP